MSLPKILHLVLYSTTHPEYKAMYYMTREWYKLFAPFGITTCYYMYDANVSQAIWDEKEMILRLPGKESLVPGILQKTLAAFDFFKKHSFDILVRSNVSTVVNLLHVVNYLRSHPLTQEPKRAFFGTHIMTTDDTSILAEDDLKSHFPLRYAQGTCFALSKKLVNLILKKREKLIKAKDTISIALFLKSAFNVTPMALGSQFVNIKYSYNINQITAFRNHRINTNRKDDVSDIRQIVHVLKQRFFYLDKPRALRNVYYYNVDVTEKVKQLCLASSTKDEKQRLAFWKPNGQNNSELDELFGDPCPNVPKTLGLHFVDTYVAPFTQCAEFTFFIQDGVLYVRG